MKNNDIGLKDMFVGEIYGIHDKREGGYHPYLVVAVSQKKIYKIQGSSVKLDINGIETNIFKEKDEDYYVIRDYEETDLKYMTAFSLSSFSWDKNIKTKKYLGFVKKWDLENIISALLLWDGIDSETKECITLEQWKKLLTISLSNA